MNLNKMLIKDCIRCGANEIQYFYKGRCRRCIGLKVGKEPESSYVQVDSVKLEFELTDEQVVISKDLVRLVQSGKNVYVEAVCGAGKTEMCIELIKESLNAGLKIGWAIPRREVVLELHNRLESVFPKLKLVKVCQDYTDEVYGDLIICTTHQLFRYHQYFDILIIDEPDAFPYHNNTMLQHMAHVAARENIVYLSATYECGDDFEVLSLSSRPSKRPLPLPKIVNIVKVMELLRKWKDEAVLIFVPTKKIAMTVSRILMCPFITSSSLNKKEILENFRKENGFLVCTTILERGVTFKDCFVIVLFADHKVFNKASLVQIAGRVERGLNPKKGEVIFWGNGIEVQKAMDYINHHRNIVLSASNRKTLEY